LIEIDCRVRVYFRACPGECVRAWICPINGGHSGQSNHVEVVSSHELDVHGLPYASGVYGPSDGALGTCIINSIGTRCIGSWIGANENQGCE